jgi:hypothetical protein
MGGVLIKPERDFPERTFKTRQDKARQRLFCVYMATWKKRRKALNGHLEH